MTAPRCRTISEATKPMRAMLVSRSARLNPKPAERCVRTTSPSSMVTTRPCSASNLASAPATVDFPAEGRPVNHTQNPVSCRVPVKMVELILPGCSVVNDSAADHRHHRLDLPDLVRRDREVIAVEHHQVRQLALLDRTEVVFLEYEVRVLARVGDQRILAADGLLDDFRAARHFPCDGEIQ